MDIKLEKKTGWRAVLSKKSLPYLFGVLLAVLVVWLLMKENASYDMLVRDAGGKHRLPVGP